MRSYQTARSLFSFMSLIGWIIIAVGIGIVLLGIGVATEMTRGVRHGPGFLPVLYMLPGVGVSILGVFTLGISQIGRAGVDTAEYSQQMLQLSRDSLEVSRQSLRQSEQMRTSFDALNVAASNGPTVSYTDLRPAQPETNSEAEPTPDQRVGYENKPTESAVATTTETLMLHAQDPSLGSSSVNGSPEAVKSS